MKSFGGSDNKFGYDVAVNPQGGYFICGETLTPAFTFYSCENYSVSTDISGNDVTAVGQYSHAGEKITSGISSC